MREAGKRNKRLVAVVCHNIRSAYNVGSIFRTADGAGVAKMYLTGYTPTPPHSGIAKAALGAEKFVPWEKARDPNSVFRKLKKGGFRIVAVEQDKRSRVFSSLRVRGNICLVLGNEVRGLSQAVLRKCDEVVEIPMSGRKESLNVSVAFGIAVYFLALGIRS